MDYNYINIQSEYGLPPGREIESYFDAYVDDAFYLSPTVHKIEEQLAIGSKEYRKIDARVNRGINVYTGRNMGDDWRRLIFKDKTHPIEMGKKYYFDKNYWLTYNADTYKNFAVSCMVKRCNNVLRWLDVHGDYHEEPAIFDLMIARARDQMSSYDLINIQGYINVYAQLNSSTEKIRENQRFLVGAKSNRIAYKVFGGGIRNFINSETFNDESAGILMLTMGGSHINPTTDDMERGIANANQLSYTIGGLPSVIDSNPGTVFKLYPSLYREHYHIPGATFAYSSSNEAIATVSADGEINMVSEGSVEVFVRYVENPKIFHSITVNILHGMSDVSVVVSPEPTYVVEGKTQVYECWLYSGGIRQSDVFDFEIDESTSVPSSSYEFEKINGNTFSIKNIKRVPYNEIVINCSSGSHIKQIKVALRGLF